jgi:hypothetical protein
MNVAQTRRWPELSGGSAVASRRLSPDASITLTERLLLEDKENRVDELHVLDVVVDHVERDEALRGSSARYSRRPDYLNAAPRVCPRER